MKNNILLLIISLCVVLSSCDDDMVMGGEDDCMFNAYPTLRVVIEDEDGNNLFNDGVENNFMSNGSALYGRFYIQYGDECPDVADWQEYDEPGFVHVRNTNSLIFYPKLFVRRLNYTPEYWENWDTENISDDEYSLCISFDLILYSIRGRSESSKFKLYIPSIYGNYHPYNFEVVYTYLDQFYDWSLDEPQHYELDRKVVVDGVEYADQVIRLKLPNAKTE